MAPIVHSWLLQGWRKATVETRLAITEGSVQWIIKGYWTSNSFQENCGFDFVCGSRVL